MAQTAAVGALKPAMAALLGVGVVEAEVVPDAAEEAAEEVTLAAAVEGKTEVTTEEGAADEITLEVGAAEEMTEIKD
jgi:hypothetical protein